MSKSIHSPAYQHFCHLLIEAREQAGLTQIGLAEKLEKPQSFVSKYERGERRLDLIEFLELAQVLQIDVPAFIQKLQEMIGQGAP